MGTAGADDRRQLAVDHSGGRAESLDGPLDEPGRRAVHPEQRGQRRVGHQGIRGHHEDPAVQEVREPSSVRADAGPERVDHDEARGQVGQQVHRHVRGLRARHLVRGAEQRGQAPGIPVDEVGHGARHHHPRGRPRPHRRHGPAVQDARLRHGRHDRLGAEVDQVVGASALGSPAHPRPLGERVDRPVPAVAVEGVQRAADGDIPAPSLDEQVDHLVHDRRARRRGLREASEHDRRAGQRGSEAMDGVGQTRDPAAPDHDAGQRLPAPDARWGHPSMKPADPRER